MKIKILFLITFLMVIRIQAQNHEFTTYNEGTIFSNITVDPNNNRVWAAPFDRGEGLYKLDLEENEASVFTQFSSEGSGPSFSIISVSSLAVDKNGNLIVGQNGFIGQIDNHYYGGLQGGVEIINNNFRRHYSSDLVVATIEGSGLGTNYISKLIVDKNNKIWVAQKGTFYQQTISVNLPSKNLYPGVLASKAENQSIFRSPGSMYDASVNGNGYPEELPQHNQFLFLDQSEDPPHRDFIALSSDDSEVWTSVDSYIAVEDNVTYDMKKRVLRYSLEGEFLGSFNNTNMLLPENVIVNNICRNNEKGTWVTTRGNRGFSILKPSGEWVHISPSDFPNVLPPNVYFLDNSFWKDKNGKVFFGSMKGLIVYDGVGPVDEESSYKIYTNYDFGADPNSSSYVFDDSMVSIGILGGCTDPNDTRTNWIATNNGIMKMGEREGIEIWHLNDYTDFTDSPEEEIFNDAASKYIGKIKNVSEVENANMVTVAADGTKATFFRIYTNNPQDYYANPSILKPIVGPIFNGDQNSDAYLEHVKRYGKVTIKTPESHDNYDYTLTENANIAQFKYVEFTYQHPEYIDFLDYEDGEVYEFIDFKLIDNNSTEIFTGSIKVSVPPILLLHGVWSSIHSMASFENFLLSKKIPNYAISKGWRTIDEKNSQLAENSYEEDAWVIPIYISELKDKAAANKFSVGKVNIVAHSRGGLYARGYIEGISSSYPYKQDVNSLITLDTPHFGSQGGNIALDHRRIPIAEVVVNTFLGSTITTLENLVGVNREITLGDLMSSFSVPKFDKPINGGENFGARNLLVEIDYVSGITAQEDTGFIRNLNTTQNLEVLRNNVPIHTIASIFDFCEISPALCSGMSESPLSAITPKWFDIMVFLALATADQGPRAANSIVQEIFNNEANDFIVPLSSMIGGLPSENFSIYGIGSPNGQNLDHTGMFGDGVTTSYAVQANVLSLLKSNVHDQSVAGRFSSDIMQHTELEYKFLENSVFLSPANQNRLANNNTTTKLLINRNPTIFDNRVEGDVLDFNVYQENIDRIMVTYKSENDPDNFQYIVKTENLAFENSFTYTIPQGYSGELTITAYGFKTGVQGYTTSTVTLNVGTPASVTLQSIHFTTEEPIILEQDNFNYSIEGTYSDGIDRRLNNEDITFIIDASSILSQVDANAVKGENIGVSLLTAAINGFEDTIIVKVRENPSLRETILTGFYGIPNADNSAIDVNWETLREYESATFVLETSYNTPDNFTEINQQAGNGTIQTPAQFNYVDTSFGANTLIYYRIKMIDTQGNITYSSTIEINLSTAGVGENNLNNLVLEIYPNPVKTGEVTLKLNSKLVDANAKLELYSLQGKRLSLQTLKVLEGANSFKLKIGQGLTSGIYLVKVSTKGYVKTIKLIVEK